MKGSYITICENGTRKPQQSYTLYGGQILGLNIQ